MLQRKVNKNLLKIRDDIVTNIDNIDCIIKIKINPKDGKNWEDNKEHWVMYFFKGQGHYEWVLIPDEFYEQIKQYIINS